MTRSRLGNAAVTGTVTPDAILRTHSRASGDTLRTVPVGAIGRSPWQPRHAILRDDDFVALVESIRSVGVLSPLLARELEGRLELLAGERRLEAAKAAGLSTVPVRVLTGLTDAAAQEVALVENLARKDLTAYEEALGILALFEVLERAGTASVRKVATLAGRSVSAVQRALTIARGCTPDVVEAAQGVLGAGGVPSWYTLPADALLTVAQGATVEARGRLLAMLSPDYTLGATGRVVRRKARPTPPFTLATAPDASRLSLTLRVPVAELDPADARAMLKQLTPYLEALRARARSV